MNNKPSTDLFILIKNLTKTEKRYFKIYAARHSIQGKNNYMQLFEAIEKQSEYDEAALKSFFKNKRIGQQFAVVKQYLYQRLLESLHLFYTEASDEEIIKRECHYITILMNKGLRKAAKKKIRQVKKKANHLERYDLYLLVLQLEKKLYASNGYKGLGAADIDKLHQEEADTLAKIAHINDYWQLSSHIYQMHYQKVVGKQAVVAQILSHELLSGLEKAETFRAKIDFLQIHATACFMKGDVKGAYRHNTQLLELLEASPAKKKLYAPKYVSVLSNFIVDSFVLNQFEAVNKGIDKLRKLPEQSIFKRIDQLGFKVFRLSYLIELNTCVKMGDFKRGQAKIKEVQNGIEQFQNYISQHDLITFYYLFAYLHFGAESYDKALHWQNTILQNTDNKKLEELYRFTNLLHIITHFEIGNFDLLEYLIKSVTRHQSKGQASASAEKIILQYLSKFLDAPSKKKQRTLWQELGQELTNVPDGRLLNYFDYRRWVQQKMGLVQ